MSESTKTRIPLCLILTIVALFILDQVTKWAIVLNFSYDWVRQYSTDVIRVLENNDWLLFNIVRVHNTGVAFGTGNGTVWAPFLFLGIQIVALVWLTLLFRKGFFNTRTLRVAWVCIMSGVLGNMADRLVQGFFRPGAEYLGFFENLMNGYVVDFLDFAFPWLKLEGWPMGYHWPSFNVADSCVCIAAGLFIISGFFMQEKKDEPQQD